MEPQEENIWQPAHTEYSWNMIWFYGKIWINSWLNQWRSGKNFNFFDDFQFNLHDIQSVWLVQSNDWTKDQYTQLAEMDVEKVKIAMECLQRCQKCYYGYVEGIHFGLRICLSNGQCLTFTVSKDGTIRVWNINGMFYIYQPSCP